MSEPRKDILQIAVAFKKEMQKAGKGFKFAKAKDITETYHYRWFSSFLDRCYEKDLDVKLSIEVIKAVVGFAKQQKILHKGVSLISRQDVFDICFKKIKMDLDDTDKLISNIKSYYGNLKSIADMELHLCKKAHRHGLHNMIIMRDNGELPDYVTCLSKACMRSYLKINNKDEMPSLKEMVVLRMKMINKIGHDILRDIYGGDYNG